MIKVSHESPIAMLDLSLKYNDYQYALAHLIDQQPEYYKWFKEKYKSKDPNGEILLDNSIFELGESYNESRYVEIIDDIKPDFYIVPDVLEDSIATMNKFEKFIKANNYIPGLKIGVVQGKNWKEISDCYKYMSDKADYIAISFDYSYYQHTGNGSTKLEKMCYGRIELIERLVREGIWNWYKPHHLLGCSLAREFKHYPGKYNIRTIDTSNPIVMGIFNHRYVNDLGCNFKISTLLANLIDHIPTQDQIENIMYNVKMFKYIINRYDV